MNTGVCSPLFADSRHCGRFRRKWASPTPKCHSLWHLCAIVKWSFLT